VFSLHHLVVGDAFWHFPMMAPPWELADGWESAGAPPASLLSLPDPIWIIDFESNGYN
jgi:hypothetical protein